ncbi:MAG: BspA family leucine-rich repeat surface protein [Prevotella sp.]|nr:BspA family leucine-rich repeat surface protein [Prevotella sp.]
MTRRYASGNIILLVLTLILASTATDLWAQARRGYALWCESATTLYFVQADTPPYTFDGKTVDYAWEITDKNIGNGVSAPLWIKSTPASAVGTVSVPEKVTTVIIDHLFRFVAPAGFYSWFHGCKNLTTVRGLSNLNTSRAGYMNKMFYGCSSLETIDFTGVDMSPVINTTMMFYGCSKLRTIYADEAWTQPYSAYMFEGCEQLQGYDSSKTDGDMAHGDDGYFNTSSNIYALCLNGVGSADDYLYFVRTPETIAQNDTYDGRTVNSVYDFDNFKTVNPDGNWTWNWSGNTLLKHVVIEPSFRNVHLTTLERFFKGMGVNPYGRGITDIDGLEYLNTSDVKSMRGMFEDNANLTVLDVSALDMSGVEDMGYMFKGCSNLTSINIAGVNTSNVTDMEYLFAGCEKLTSVDLSSLDTRKVTKMNHLFDGCWSLTSIDVSPLNTSSVTDMEGMFAGCHMDADAVKSGLVELDVNTFDMTNVTNVKEMFLNCGALQTIFCDNTWNIEMSDDMFKGCTKLSAHIAYDPDKVNGDYANPHTGYFYSEQDPPTYDSQGRFIVSSKDMWVEFARRVNNGETGLNAIMKKDVDLGDSQVMAGTTEHPYSGTFEGNGHTLNIAYVCTEENCAPFSIVGGCTIQNLQVTGTINTSAKSASGLIGTTTNSSSELNISKCRSSVTINSTIDGLGSLGGFIGMHSGKVKVNMSNCLFDGAIIGEKTYGCGGFIGSVMEDNNSRKVNVYHSLMNATAQFSDGYKRPYYSGVFYGFHSSTQQTYSYYNCVSIDNDSGYTTSFGSVYQQGKDWTTETVAQIVSWLNLNNIDRCWIVVDGKPALQY